MNMRSWYHSKSSSLIWKIRTVLTAVSFMPQFAKKAAQIREELPCIWACTHLHLHTSLTYQYILWKVLSDVNAQTFYCSLQKYCPIYWHVYVTLICLPLRTIMLAPMLINHMPRAFENIKTPWLFQKCNKPV
jgi:hypothetical protein